MDSARINSFLFLLILVSLGFGGYVRWSLPNRPIFIEDNRTRAKLMNCSVHGLFHFLNQKQSAVGGLQYLLPCRFSLGRGGW